MGFSQSTIPVAAAAAAKSLQSCPTLCDPIDGSPAGSTVPGILQARTLEWVAISFSNAWKWKAKVKSLNRVRLFVTPWTAAHQAPLSMGFSRQEYWSGVPLPSPRWQLYKCINIVDINWVVNSSAGKIQMDFFYSGSRHVNLEVSAITKYMSILWSSNFTPSCIPERNKYMCQIKDLPRNAWSSFIHKSPNQK